MIWGSEVQIVESLDVGLLVEVEMLGKEAEGGEVVGSSFVWWWGVVCVVGTR